MIDYELADNWLWCNVYTLNVVTIKEKIFAVLDKFFKLSKRPKKRKKGKFLKVVENFMANMPKLLDILRKSSKTESTKNTISTTDDKR